jgi:hypothetical protein
VCERFGQRAHATRRQRRAPTHQHAQVEKCHSRGHAEVRPQPDAGQKWPEERLDRHIREPKRAQLLLDGAAGLRHVPNTVPACGRQTQGQTRQTHAIAQSEQWRTQSLQDVRWVPQWIAQEDGSTAGDDRRAIVEQPQVQPAQVNHPPQRGIRREQHLEPAIQHESVRRDIGADPAADGVAGFEDYHRSTGLGQLSGTRQAGDTGADHDDGWRLDGIHAAALTGCERVSTIWRVIRWRYANRRPRNVRNARFSTGSRLPPGNAYSSSSRNHAPSPSGSTR